MTSKDGPIIIPMDKEKETKNAVRYGDGENHNIYLTKDEVSKAGLGDSVVVEIKPA